MAFTGHEDHTIPVSDGAALTKEFRRRYPAQPKGYFFSKDSLTEMLSSTAVGLRFYFGCDSDGKLKLVFCGCDANENDIIGTKVGDGGNICPPACGNPDVLNC